MMIKAYQKNGDNRQRESKIDWDFTDFKDENRASIRSSSLCVRGLVDHVMTIA